jgi:hypothetical protein
VPIRLRAGRYGDIGSEAVAVRRREPIPRPVVISIILASLQGSGALADGWRANSSACKVLG